MPIEDVLKRSPNVRDLTEVARSRLFQNPFYIEEHVQVLFEQLRNNRFSFDTYSFVNYLFADRLDEVPSMKDVELEIDRVNQIYSNGKKNDPNVKWDRLNTLTDIKLSFPGQDMSTLAAPTTRDLEQNFARLGEELDKDYNQPREAEGLARLYVEVAFQARILGYEVPKEEDFNSAWEKVDKEKLKIDLGKIGLIGELMFLSSLRLVSPKKYKEFGQVNEDFWRRFHEALGGVSMALEWDPAEAHILFQTAFYGGILKAPVAMIEDGQIKLYEEYPESVDILPLPETRRFS